MSEQFMLPLGLAGVISCCVMSCFIVLLRRQINLNLNSNLNNKKHLKNVGLIRHCEPPHALILHCHSPGVATVARRLRIDVRDDDNDNDNA